MPETNKSILIIDDDVTVRKLIQHHLKKNGFVTQVAEGSVEGYKILNETPVDLVLCDVTMQGMNGFDFCRKVREENKFKTLPFVFVTAKSSIEDKSNALDAGGDDIITKPFDIDVLILKVRALIRKADIFKTYGGAEKKDVQDAFALQKTKILLVDDDNKLLKLFQYNLNKEGFECTAVSGAEEGFKTA